MKLRRKNEYLETLFENMSNVSGEANLIEEIKTESHIQRGGEGEIKAIFNNLLKSINDFTDKWSKKSSMKYGCDETEIKQGNIDITLKTDLTTYFP